MRFTNNHQAAFTLAEAATQVDISANNRRAAFTLAEVLVTLGIIGVVAAMTLPAIINKSNEYILKQQFKKVYNTLQNAQLRIYADTESYYNCFYLSPREPNDPQTTNAECRIMTEHLRKILNPLTICDGDAYAKGCIPKYKGIDTVKLEYDPDADLTYIMKNCPGFTQEKILNNAKIWVLKDGSIVGWYDYNNQYGPLIFIDVNGNKKPNKWGYDVFPMIWYGNKKRVWLEADGVCTMAEKGGKSSKQMLQDIWK